MAKDKILSGRKAVDAYRQAHTQLHSQPWHRGIPEEHTPLLEKMLADLKEQGFNSLEEYFQAARKSGIGIISPDFSLADVPLRFLVQDSGGLFVGAVTECRRADLIPDTVLLSYLPTPRFGVPSKMSREEIEEQLDLEFCQANNIPVITYVHDERLSAVMYLEAFSPQFDVITKRALMSLDYGRVLCLSVLERLGVNAEIGQANNIMVGGRKITSVSLYESEGVARLGGIFNLSLQTSLLDLAFHPPESKLHGLAKISEWMTSVEQEINREVPMEEFTASFVAAFEELFHLRLEQTMPTSEELAKLELFRKTRRVV